MRFYRAERGLSQAELARRAGMEQRVLSAIETGRRRISGESEFMSLLNALALCEPEARQLREAQNMSSRRIRLPVDVTPRELRLIHQLASRVGDLGEEQIAQISRALKIEQEM
jgi:DNA-binding XRE family transcriptional regulator